MKSFLYIGVWLALAACAGCTSITPSTKESAQWLTKQDNPEGKLPKLTKPLVLDAKLDEWEGATSLSLRYASYISTLKPGHEWHGPKDAGAEMVCAWNDEGLCLAVLVTDDDVHNERPPHSIWQQDCLEIR